MSGGFFRGTSADQDTRFSNKQAKLMKSQKFPPELEHLVDMTKVKLEVLKPWIANRVTELIGFEDEVLINFIYTLLDGKLVNGKEVQISLTGFMERNTGKFMKELWSLLLSAQQNTSGVPQQFLDAKEEETRKKQAETDRITNEIERKREKEKREIEGGSLKNMDGNADYGRSNNASLEPKRQYRTSSRRSADEEKESNGRSGSRGRGSSPHSPRPADVSPPPRRKRSRSRSKSFSNSRSRSNERLRSRKASRSPQSRGRSISSERRDRSPPRRSISPRRRRSPRRYSSPPRRRYPNSRRRSISPSRYRSPSPRRQRMQSPLRRRYRSPIRRRSRSPINRRSRSPVRQRSSSQSRSISRSPLRRRSPPFRRRSRTPVRQRSPIYIRRRSPPVPRHQHRRSPSPRRRSPSQLRRRSPTFRRRSVSPRRRSLSPQDSSSPSAADHSSPSPPIRRSPEGKGRSPARSPAGRIRVRDKYSPARNSSPSEDADRAIKTRRGSDSTDHHRNSPEPSRSSQRDSFDRNGSRRKLSPLPPPPPPRRSPSGSKSPPVERRGSYIDDRVKGAYEHSTRIQKKKVIDSDSPKSPPRLAKQKVYHDNSDSSMDGAPTMYISDKKRGSRDNLKGSSDKVRREDKPADKIADDHTGKLNNHSTVPEPRKKVEALKSDRPGRLDRLEASDHKEFTGSHRVSSSKKKEPYDEEGDRTNKVLLNDIRGREQKTEVLPKLALKGERHDQSGPVDANSDESDKERTKGKDKRKHRKSEKDEVASDDDSSSDSYVEDRKDSKRKRKEEKKLKKEERRRRREERRRRKEEKRAEKRRRKLSDATAPPSDSEGNLYSHSSDDEHIRNQKKRSSGIEHKEADPKELEIALREKALESLRAKKGIAR